LEHTYVNYTKQGLINIGSTASHQLWQIALNYYQGSPFCIFWQ